MLCEASVRSAFFDTSDPKKWPAQCKDINDYLSSMCDLRVIWGGDETIRNLRMSPLPARATEIVFADRYSLAVIDARWKRISVSYERTAARGQGCLAEGQ